MEKRHWSRNLEARCEAKRMILFQLRLISADDRSRTDLHRLFFMMRWFDKSTSG
jgi:hypothetical protein